MGRCGRSLCIRAVVISSAPCTKERRKKGDRFSFIRSRSPELAASGLALVTDAESAHVFCAGFRSFGNDAFLLKPKCRNPAPFGIRCAMRGQLSLLSDCSRHRKCQLSERSGIGGIGTGNRAQHMRAIERRGCERSDPIQCRRERKCAMTTDATVAWHQSGDPAGCRRCAYRATGIGRQRDRAQPCRNRDC